MTGHSPVPVLAAIAVGVFVSVLSAMLLLRDDDAADASGARARLTTISPPLLSPVSALPALRRVEPARTPAATTRTARRRRAVARPVAPIATPRVAPTATPVAPPPTVAAPRPAPAAPTPTRSPSNVGSRFDSSG